MVRPFPGFAIGLAAVAQLTQQQAHQLLADPEAAAEEGSGDLALAAADPAQRRLGIAADRVLDQRFQRRRQVRLQHHRTLAPTTGAANPRADWIDAALQLHDRPPDRAARQPGRSRRRAYPAIAEGQSLIRREQTTTAFVEELGRLPIPRPEVINIDHAGGLPEPTRAPSAAFRPHPRTRQSNLIQLFRLGPLAGSGHAHLRLIDRRPPSRLAAIPPRIHRRFAAFYRLL